MPTYWARRPTHDSYQLVLDGKYADSRAWTFAESVASFDKIAWIPKLDAESFLQEMFRISLLKKGVRNELVS